MRYFKKIGITSLLFLVLCVGYAQKHAGFIKTYKNGSGCYALVQTSDSGYILAAQDTGGTYLIKTKNNGDTLWAKQFFDKASLYQIKKTEDNKYIAVGVTKISLSSNDDAYILKIDSIGNKIWSKNYGGIYKDGVWQVEETLSGEYIVSGFITSIKKGWDAYLLKLGSNGDTLWTMEYGGGGTYDESGTATILPDSGYLIAMSSFYDYDNVGYRRWKIYLTKTNNKGDSLWTKIYDRDVNCMKSIKTKDGNCIVVGDSSSGVCTYLLKADTVGHIMWEGSYGKSNTPVRGIAQSSDGGYVVCGRTYNPYNNTESDVSLIKVDSLGHFLYQKQYGWKESDDFSWDIIQTFDGGYALAGFTWGGFPIPTSKALLIKTDSLGCVYYPGAYFTADTQQIKQGDTIHFTDASQVILDTAVAYQDSIVSRQWYFGDGDTSTMQSPLHQYKDSGSYTVKLVVTNISDCSDSAVKKGYIRVVKPVGLKEFEVQSLKFEVYPNPADNELNIVLNNDGTQQYTTQMMNLLGQTVYKQQFQKTVKIDVSNFNKGLYFIKVRNSITGEQQIQKVVVR